jgi:NDP-sugar pyrophosphorylase family protein
VILVAGKGTRLGVRTTLGPKCLVEVNGTAILRNALEQLASLQFAETVLVVGYREDAIRQAVGDKLNGMRIRYRTNARFDSTGTAHSLQIGLQNVDEDALLLEGDVYFDERALRHFLLAPHQNVTLVEAWNPMLDGSVVELGPGSLVRRWIHKDNRPPDFAPAGTYKTVNIHRVSRAFLREHLRPALDREAASGGTAPLEAVFDGIVRRWGAGSSGSTGSPTAIHAVEVRGRWVEIDDERDLQRAEAIFAGAAHGSR